MAEYIEREALIEEAEQDSNLRFIVPLDKIKKIPTADVKPVKHGRWICEETLGIISLNGYECSICHNYNGRATKYCPNCGAKMDLEGR